MTDLAAGSIALQLVQKLGVVQGKTAVGREDLSELSPIRRGTFREPRLCDHGEEEEE